MPKSKSIFEHQVSGTYREDRHGTRLDGRKLPPLKRQPAGLSPEQKRVWKCVTECLPEGALASIDSVALELAGKLLAGFESLNESDEPRERSLALAYMRELHSIMAEFGWTPRSRAKLHAPPPRENSDDKKFFAGPATVKIS